MAANSLTGYSLPSVNDVRGHAAIVALFKKGERRLTKVVKPMAKRSSLDQKPSKAELESSSTMLSSRRSLRAILLLSVCQPRSFLIAPLIVRPR